MNLPANATPRQLAALQQEVAALRDDVRRMLEAQRARETFLEEMQPIFKEVMSTATERLASFEDPAATRPLHAVSDGLAKGRHHLRQGRSR